MLPEQLWESTLGQVEVEISKANFTTWFKDTFIFSYQNGEIIIGVPNAFTKTWLENKYHDSIVKKLRGSADEDIRLVTYKVASKHKHQQQTAAQVIAQQETVNTATDSTPVQETPATQQTTNTVTVEGPTSSITSMGLNPRYTFENFVVGKKNELAHAACKAVGEKPGETYNPLFLYGGVGLGKTHLMQAVGHAALKNNPNTKILYVTCETFTNEYITSVQEGRASQFKDKYRSVDILMVDDIQFLAGKEGTQEAFFHTFNHLHQTNKQILLTSDRPPRAIPTLEDRLVSRFEGGMLVDVNLPDLETRIAILRRKCEEKKLHISETVIQQVAKSVQNNVRELEGALNRVLAYHELNGQALTEDSVKNILSTFTQTSSRGAITTKKILHTVTEYFEIQHEDLLGNSRKKELVVPRQIAMFLMREEIHASYPNIGQELGGRDHTTAMHACQKIARLLDEDEKMQNDVEMLKQRLYQ